MNNFPIPDLPNFLEYDREPRIIWNDILTLKFVNEFVKHECLYKYSCPDYGSKERRYAALYSISKGLGPGLTIGDICDKEQSVLREYAKEYRKIMLSTTMSDAGRVRSSYMPQAKWFRVLNAAMKEQTYGHVHYYEPHVPDDNMQYARVYRGGHEGDNLHLFAMVIPDQRENEEGDGDLFNNADLAAAQDEIRQAVAQEGIRQAAALNANNNELDGDDSDSEYGLAGNREANARRSAHYLSVEQLAKIIRSINM